MRVLKGLNVVDLGVGMAPALVARFLADSGASVARAEPQGGDPFYDYYPAYEVWRRGAEPIAGTADIEARLAVADICIVGGEDFPGLQRGPNVSQIASRHPHLVVLDIQGYPDGVAEPGRPATDLLLQARSGLSYEHYADRPILMGFQPASYGAAMRGVIGVLAALYERETSGAGQLVSTSLFEGALAWVGMLWVDFERATPVNRFVLPKDPFPLVFRAADGKFIHIVLGAAGSKYKMYQALEIDDPSVQPTDSGMPQPGGDPRNFFGDIDVLAAHVAKKPSAELLQKIWALGLPAEPVEPPGACWDHPQIERNGTIERGPDGLRRVGFPFGMRASTGGPRTRREAPQRARPLEGVRVLDFGTFIAGPLASVVLADLGADVIKVETPAGDPGRAIPRAFNAACRGKRAIAVDLKAPDGLRLAQALAARSDVIMSNFRTGVPERLGIAPSQLHGLQPDLIVLEAPAYGAEGPLADRAGFDMVMQAWCGHEFRGGGRNNDPLWNRTSMVDACGGMLGAIAALLGLYHRARTGEGVAIESALVSAGIFLLSELVQQPDGEFIGAPVLNSCCTGYHPAEAIYATRDGWIAIAARGASAALKLAEALEIDAGALGAPATWGDDAAAAIAACVEAADTATIAARLEQAGIWTEPCRRDVEQTMLYDSALLALGVVRSSQHPAFGAARETGLLVRFSRSPSGNALHAPLKGEHNEAVLREFGYTQTEIEDFVARKIVL